MGRKTILLHGLGQTPSDWDDVIRRAGLTAFDCPDLRELAGETMEYSALLRGLEQRCGEQEGLCLCGMSLGAVLALDYALRHREQTASLVLIGVQYRMPKRLIDFQNAVFRCLPAAAFRRTGFRKQQMKTLTSSMRELDFTDQLSELQCPVSIVCGGRDVANRSAARTLKDLLPRAELRIVPGVGHEVNRLAPDDVAAILRRMTSDHAGSSKDGLSRETGVEM